MPSVYSNAFNFTSFQDGRTDLRTGQFSAIVNLATIRPQGASEGSREIKLVFSALNTTNAGYGIGWSISESQFNPTNRVLSLANGETFTASALPPVGYQIPFPDTKLKNLIVTLADNSTVKVYYIDGTVEILRRPSPSGPYRTAELIFENGETFRYNYAPSGVLERIINAATNTEVLTIRCSFNVLERVRTMVQGGKIAEIFCTASNQLITSITIPYDNTSGTVDPRNLPRYVYSYEATQQGFHLIRQITNPMGGMMRIQYRHQELRYYNNSTYLPAVIVCESIPGAGQPSVVKTYRYTTDVNFTGYPYTGGGFQAGRDNLYFVTVPYEYWGEETTIDPEAPADKNVIERVKSTFNKFHLMTREEKQRGTALTVQEYLYNEASGSFPQQPPNLQVPKQLTTTYRNTEDGLSRSEALTVESDQYGNTIKKIEASGLRFEYEYYPITGDGANCPADPSGNFVRYCRQEKIVPADNGPARTTQMTYEQASVVTAVSPAFGISYFVLERVRTSNTGMVSTNRYVNAPGQPMVHGRPASTEVEIGGRRTQTHFTYVQSGTDLEERREVKGYDDTVTWASQKFCTVTQLILQAQKAGEANVVFEYDVIGRVVRQTVAPGTVNAASNDYVYHFAISSPSTPARVEEADAKGRRYVTRYDGLGQLVSAAQLLDGGQERQIKTIVYNRLGNKAEETIYDQLENEVLTLRTRYEYNGWNELARTIQPDNTVALSERDMIANTLTTGIQGLNTTINRYNKFNKAEEVTQASTSGQKVNTLNRSYDGFGRCVSATDVYKNETRYVYDGFDRVLEIQTRPVDGTAPRTVKMSYAAFSSADLPTETAVNSTVLGRRVYDGIGRMTSTANGQASPITYTYDGAALRPASATSPRGIRLGYSYNSDLGTLTKVISPDDGACQFTYDPVSGQVADAGNNTANRQSAYDQYGALVSEKTTVAGQRTEAAYTTSPAGRPLRVTTPLGETLAQGYDSAGRPRESAGGGFKEDITYNASGQVASVSVSLSGIRSEAVLTYDSFGREATRTLRVQGSVWQTIQQSYSASGQLVERITKDGANVLVNQDTFTYDAYSRLTAFTCTGSRYPKDSRGRQVKSQKFTYDLLNNITRVESGYADGATNISSRSFSTTVPTQLIRIEETQPVGSYSLSYDADGNLSRDHQGRTYSYDQFGRLSSCSSAGFYGYDADGRLVTQTPVNAQPLQFFYSQDVLTGQRQGGTSVSFFRDGNAAHGRTVRTGTATTSDIYELDSSNSVIGRTGQDGRTSGIMYTPYGESDLNIGARPDELATQPAIAFNGQHLDVLANLYHLGNGRRAYSPELMVFLSPDPLSPFGDGGLNPYAYCNGDPINMVDPSGLKGLLKALIGLIVAVIVFVAAVASVVTGGASLLAVAGAIGAGLGLVSATLNVASEGIAAVDEKQGWDRSGTAKKIDIASNVFGKLSTAVSLGTSVGSGVSAGRAVGKKGTLATKAAPGKISNRTGQKIASGFTEGAKSFIGVSAEETFSKGANRFLTVVGVGSFTAGTIGTVKGIVENSQPQSATYGSNGSGQGEVDLSTTSGRTGAGGEAAGGSPFQPSFDLIWDSIASLNNASEEYDQVAKSVRQPINSQLYYGVG